ncbi:MAG: hypothetical protein AVDCRST_MAG73-4082, partial [uncultured Thermomicrobiales bacterium]
GQPLGDRRVADEAWRAGGAAAGPRQGGAGPRRRPRAVPGARRPLGASRSARDAGQRRDRPPPVRRGRLPAGRGLVDAVARRRVRAGGRAGQTALPGVECRTAGSATGVGSSL